MSEMPSGTGYEPPRNPGQIGGVDKKWWIIGGVAAAGIVYYAYKKSASSAASSGDTAAGVDPNTGLPYSSGQAYGGIDPTTGYSYASEFTSPAPQNSVDPTTGIPYALEGPIDPTTGIPYSVEGQPAPSTTPTTPAAPDLPSEDWLNAAVTASTAHGTTDAHARQALADYLSGLPLSPTDLGIVEHAIGLVGSAPGSPTVHQVPATTNHPSGGITKKKTTHPVVHRPVVAKPVKKVLAKPPVAKAKAKAKVTHYRVKAGDNLTKIARRFHLSLKQLEKLNPKIKNPNVIHTGQEINV